jgi:uracil-DNA glycosylase
MINDDYLKKLSILNSQIKNCDRCRLSSTRTNAICGEGSVNARIFFIAQAPGEIEDKEGKMFIGPTGKVVDELFHEIDLRRDDIYMTNLIKCNLPKNRKPKKDEIEICSQYLRQEIAIIKPEFIIPLGYHATKYILKYYDCENILSSDFTGKLLYCSGQKIYPLRHPSAVLYNPSFKLTMSMNFKKISIFKKECKWYPVCPMKKFYEDGILERKWIELYCKGDWKSCKRYQMEEDGRFHPDEMLPDGSILKIG